MKAIIMILNLVTPKDPILNTELEEFDPRSIELENLVSDMFETMYHYKGVGLSANQVGLKYRLFVMGTPEMELVFINPKIRTYSTETVTAEEGCLTHPGFFLKVKRPVEVRVTSTNMQGETQALTYKGMTARILQHEYDHIQGIDYQRRASRFHLEQARRQYKRKMKSGIL